MENTRIKLWGGLVFILLNTVFVHAQENELGVSVYGGLGKVKFEKSDIMDGNNGGVSLDYYLRLDQNWGISTGLNFGRYQLKIDQKDYSDSYMTTDSEGDEFEFRFKMDQLTETLKGNYFAIPLNVRYETTRVSATNFYAQAGLQYRIYSKATSKISIDQLQTSGYFPSWDAELFEPEFMGFGKFENRNEERKLELKSSFSLLGEIGVRQTLNNNQLLYLGFYIDYNLANEVKDQLPTINYQTEGVSRLDLSSRLERQNQDRGQLRMFAIGLKVRYAFSM